MGFDGGPSGSDKGVLEPFQWGTSLFYLYTLENLINRSNTVRAREIADDLVRMAPDFVPGKVYRRQLKPNMAKRQEYLETLKRDYPDRWIFVQI